MRRTHLRDAGWYKSIVSDPLVPTVGRHAQCRSHAVDPPNHGEHANPVVEDRSNAADFESGDTLVIYI